MTAWCCMCAPFRARQNGPKSVQCVFNMMGPHLRLSGPQSILWTPPTTPPTTPLCMVSMGAALPERTPDPWLGPGGSYQASPTRAHAA